MNSGTMGFIGTMIHLIFARDYAVPVCIDTKSVTSADLPTIVSTLTSQQ